MSAAARGLLLVALLSACTQQEPSPQATMAVVSDAPTTEAASPADTPAPSPSPSPEPSASAPASPEASAAAAETRPLAIEQRHPNGSVLRVTSIAVAPTSITIGAEVVNGLADPIQLRGGRGVRLEDDRGQVYEFIPPPDNGELVIPGRGTLTGDLVFYGVLSPGATVLTLQTFQFETGPRETIDVASQTATDTFPKFSVDIPLDA